MTNFLRKFLLLVSLVFLPFFCQNVFACSCHNIPTPYKAYENSTAVFVGKVIEVSDFTGNNLNKDKLSEIQANALSVRSSTSVYYKFEIQKLLKGTNNSEIKVLTDINMCQFGFEIGSTYLVYAYGSEKGSLTTHLFCSRTDEMITAQDDVHFLRALLKNRPEPRIYGSVQREEKDSSTNSFQYTYLEGIKIIAESGKKKYITVTDKNGLYSFDKLPNGKYKVYPELPKGLEIFSFPIDEINLTTKDEIFNSSYRIFAGRNAYSAFTVRRND